MYYTTRVPTNLIKAKTILDLADTVHVLITHDLEVDSILGVLGVKSECRTLFVLADDGEIIEVYGALGIVPHLDKPVELLYRDVPALRAFIKAYKEN